MNHLKQIRKAKKITQRAIANFLHVSQSTVSKWERGDNDPDLDVALKLCTYLDVDFNTLFAFEGRKTKKVIPIYLEPRLSHFEKRQFLLDGSTSYHRPKSSNSGTLFFEEEKRLSQKIETKIFSFFLETNINMETRFCKGDMILVEEGVLPAYQGEVVIAKDNEPFRIAFASRFLHSILLHFSNGKQSHFLNLPLKKDDHVRIIGRVLECRRHYNQENSLL